MMVVAMAVAACAASGAVGGMTQRTAGATHRPAAGIRDLAFMSGCWRGQTRDGGTIEEHYTTPSSNMILGVTRYTRGGRTVDFEFTRIEQGDSGIAIIPQPQGAPPTRFALTAADAGSATWDNPAHDFPQRIVYRRVTPDSLVARIEGPGPNGPRAMEWRMARVACDER